MPYREIDRRSPRPPIRPPTPDAAMRAPESATRVQVVVSDRGAEYSRAFERIDEAAGFLARLAGDSA